MGHNKSKHLSLVQDPQNSEEIKRVLRLEASREDRRKRRKWRKKQGYSLPTGMDMVGKLSAASSHTDLPDIDQDDAVLVSYSQSNAEKFSHLRPIYQRRASSEEPEHVHVIHITDDKVPNPSPVCKKSIVSIKSTDEDILNVIENSFNKAPSPHLDPEDLDLLNSLVPEPRIVIPEIIQNESNTTTTVVETHNQPSDNDEEQIAPPSPYANDNATKIEHEIDKVEKEEEKVQEENEVQIDEMHEAADVEEEDAFSSSNQEETPAEPISVEVIIAENEEEDEVDKPTKILKDIDESANLIDEDFYPSFRPSIDCDVLNSVIVEENDEDIQSVSSLLDDGKVPDQPVAISSPNKELLKEQVEEEEIAENKETETLMREKVDELITQHNDDNNEASRKFSVSSRCLMMPSSDPNVGKETDVDDSEEEQGFLTFAIFEMIFFIF